MENAYKYSENVATDQSEGKIGAKRDISNLSLVIRVARHTLVAANVHHNHPTKVGLSNEETEP